MNCKSFQEELYDYLDGALSPARAAAAQKHLVQCDPCREAVRREQQLGQFLSFKLEEIAKTLVVDSELQSRIKTALDREPSVVPREIFFVRLWTRLALPLAAGAAVLAVAGFLVSHSFSTRSVPRVKAALTEAGSHQISVFFDLSYCVPAYTFRQEGGFVTDAMTCESRDLIGVLLVRN
jgi:anti-sigma factor RsiW